MKLSTRLRYGVRLLVYLGAKKETKCVSLHEIALQEDISEKYLEQIVGKLKSAGMICVERGPKGGYKLLKKLRQITLKDIMDVLDGPLKLIDCIDNKICKRQEYCPTKDIWYGLQKSMEKYLSSLTLEDLVEKKQEKMMLNMYFI